MRRILKLLFITVFVQKTFADYRFLNGTNQNDAQLGSANSVTCWCSTGTGQWFNRSFVTTPSARQLSRTLFASQRQKNAILNPLQPQLSQFMPFMALLIAMDMARLPLNQSDTPLTDAIPLCDAYLDPNCQGNASYNISPVQRLGVDFVNQQTSFIDASFLYGTSTARLQPLRLFQNGKLALTDSHLLPRVSSVSQMGAAFTVRTTQTPWTRLSKGALPANENITMDLFYAGEPRVNNHIANVAMVTIFAREHNTRCDQLKQRYPDWSDDQLFERARVWVIAFFQKILFQEYLPYLLGEMIEPYSGYDASVNPALDIFFQAASFRYGHSALDNVLIRLDAKGQPHSRGHLQTRDCMFNPQPILEDGIEPILRGLCLQHERAVDLLMADDYLNYLKTTDMPFDLASLDILRGRDVRLPLYNEARLAHGLPIVQSFNDSVFDPDMKPLLAQLYLSPNEMDAYIGGLAEIPNPYSTLGPLFCANVKQQFLRTRQSDRYWYEQRGKNNVTDGYLTDDEWAELENESFSKMVQRNTNLTWFPPNPFVAVPLAQSTLFDSSSSTNITVVQSAQNNVQLTGDIRFEWEFVSDTRILFRLCNNRTTDNAWMGLGITLSLTMDGSDLMLASQDPTTGQWQVLDMHAIIHFVLLDDSQDLQDVQDASAKCYSRRGVSWTRLDITQDRDDLPIQRQGLNSFIFSYGDDVSPTYHGPNQRGAFTINLQTANGSPVNIATTSNSIVSSGSLHGIFMFGVFNFAFPFGLYMARYSTNVKYWLDVHEFTMSLATTNAVSSAASALFWGVITDSI